MTEQTILQRIADGDQRAVAECMDRYGGLVWSLARRFLGNQADAEDAVQEIFIELWRSAARFDPSIAAETTFISTITRRRLIDRIRSSGRKPIIESLNDEDSYIEPAVLGDMESSIEFDEVEHILDEIDPVHRNIIVMSLYEGYTHTEISNTLDIPLGTVKTRVRRGLMHIREQLGQVGNDDTEEAI